jgi:hypothetical protein
MDKEGVSLRLYIGGKSEENGAKEYHLLHCLRVFIVSVLFAVSFLHFHHAYLQLAIAGMQVAY